MTRGSLARFGHLPVPSAPPRGTSRLLPSGAPLTICPSDSILRVQVGDVIAFAFDARVSGSPNLVLSAGYIRGTPDDFLMPGVERLTLAEVRSLAALPATDAVSASDGPARGVPVVPLLVAGLLAALVFLVGTRRATCP